MLQRQPFDVLATRYTRQTRQRCDRPTRRTHPATPSPTYKLALTPFSHESFCSDGRNITKSAPPDGTRSAVPARVGPNRANELLCGGGATGTDGAWFGGLGADAVGFDEAFQVRVVGTVEVDLLAPGRGHHGGFEAGIGAGEDVGLALGDVLQLRYLILREVGGVGDPDRTVLQRVDGVLVADGFVVVAAILPNGIVRPPDRRTLVVVYVCGRVLARGADVVCLDVVWGAAGRFLPYGEHRERDEPADDEDDDRTNDKVHPSGAIRPAASPNPRAALGHDLPLSSSRWNRSTCARNLRV